jgi:outer membrane putative beta-barrel porin/alpha-amylase
MAWVVRSTTGGRTRSGATRWTIGIALVALVASPAWAGRPLTTEDVETLDPGKVELELSLDHGRDAGAEVFLLPGGPTLNIGLLPRLEGGVGVAFVLLHPQDRRVEAGIGDTMIRLKYRVLDEGPALPALMMAVAARLPTGDASRGLGEREVAVQLLAVAAKTLPPVTLTFNGGYTFVSRDRDLDVVNANAAAEAGITKRWSIVAEVVAELTTSRRADNRVVVRGGSVYAISERFRLDAAVGVGATRASPDVLLTIGITVALN